jgi:MoaA/NifB/PqqE/SkfB family radical SAM enzyme
VRAGRGHEFAWRRDGPRVSVETCIPERFDFVRKLTLFPHKVDAAMRRDLPGALAVVYLDLNTDICNHNCPFCDGFYRSLTAAHLPWPRLERLIAEMEELGVLSVVLAGDRGEPLLHPQIDRIMTRLAESTIRYGLYTNGVLIKPVIWPSLSRAAFVRVSVDAATPATHALMHGYPADRGDFDCVVRHVRRLSEVQGDVGVSFVLTPGNAHEIAAAADCFLNAGARFIEYKPHYLPGYGLDTIWLRSAAAHVCTEIDRSRARWGARIVVNNQIDATLACLPETLRTAPRTCLTSLLRLVISTHGCYTCTPYRGEAERRVGDILEQSLRDVVDSCARHRLLQCACGRLCAYHEQNEWLLSADRGEQATGDRRGPLPSVPQDYFI